MDSSAVEKNLLDMRDELIKRLVGIDQDYRQGRSADSGERATETENDEVLVELRREANEELQLIAIALRRLQYGNYGVCSVCGEAISKERLAALPYTNKCINCG